MKRRLHHNGFSRRLIALIGVVMPFIIFGELSLSLLPSSYVSAAGRLIASTDEDIVLDSAYCFDAWRGGVKPTNASMIEEQWGAYTNWNADFVVSFDRPVLANSVALYGQAAMFGEKWIPMLIEKDLAANEPYRLLEDGLLKGFPDISVSYFDIAESIIRFQCGVKNLLLENIGTTMTIELRLTDPYSSVTQTLNSQTCTFYAPGKANWFDARIMEYINWPADANKAVGGKWRVMAGSIADSVKLAKPGVLSIDEEEIEFAANNPRILGKSADRISASSEINVSVFEIESLPVVDPTWKGGVIRVVEADGQAYYGLAQTGSSNSWQRLEGPAPKDGRVNFTMTLRYRNPCPVINYTIDGVDCKLNGTKHIPIILSGEVKSVSLSGVGEVTSLTAATESGLLLGIK